ncbi:transglycosylase SLT domain-containing protein [Streptomyces sp. C10-9-1]|uniref:transglycosylase SLT domain-containing protein n=1 Tax=Streptomyces sp. C10-9-1 TaxID=1859285 RepID=UPI002111F33C|nr:transglycosylase SLT domain-containing protein [Streptomyces sp. C10-9-1]MCQ6556700.1 transglycosylase SLT domain-containing protein [Streptomyces sp. C10-9-1]
MSVLNSPALRRLRSRKAAVAGVAVASAAAVGLTLVPTDADAGTTTEVAAAAPVSWKVDPAQAAKVQESIATQQSSFEAQVKAQLEKKKAEAEAAKKKAEAAEKAEAEKKAKAAAEKRAEEKAAADRKARAAKPAKVTYPNNLDGWIREALSIMKKHDIPGSYEGIHRNIMRESSGNPLAINNWDINARNGVPSKGLLQVIKPTFDAYHVPGTKKDQYDPVANIVAACNYAADRYGSMDNVDSAY